jgi:hypothetical protein
MLKKYVRTFQDYLWALPHGEFSVETRPVVREERFKKFARIPVIRFFIALFFIIKDDAYIRPHKPDPNKPMFYRYYLWKVHNCGRRKDGTMYTSGAAALIIYEDDKEIYNSNVDKVPYNQLKKRFGING